MLLEQMLEFFDMDDLSGEPKANSFPDNITTMSPHEKSAWIISVMQKFFQHYGYIQPLAEGMYIGMIQTFRLLVLVTQWLDMGSV